MTHARNTLSGLLVAAAVPMAIAATMDCCQPVEPVPPPSPKYPHNINSDPFEPIYINPFDPFPDGGPHDVTPPVLGLGDMTSDRPASPRLEGRS